MEPYDYASFTGTSASMVADTIRKIRNIRKYLTVGQVADSYQIDDLDCIVSDLTALLDTLPAHLRDCLRI